MPWTAITEATLESHAVASLLEVCKSTDADLVTNRFTQIRDSVVQQIRVAIASGDNDLDSDETLIPQELVSCAAWLIIEQLVAAIPGNALPLSEDQRSLLRSERARLDKVAAGDLLVSAPANPEEESTVPASGPSVTEVGSRGRLYSRSSLSGL
jgi:hypothetical protein